MLQSILKTEPYCKYEDLINKLKKEVNFDAKKETQSICQ